MTYATEFDKQVSVHSMASSPDAILVTSGSASAIGAIINGEPRVFRAVRAEGAGTLTLTLASGRSHVSTFKDGETKFLAFTHITAMSGPSQAECLA